MSLGRKLYGMSPGKSIIRVLPPSVVEKIAAGEVIERPISVVKELVENSLDSRASRIDVVMEDGGMSLISVVDNGCGIEVDDLPLALRRHATSKLSSVDDLFSISTMGFRGEALASIAAVSRLRLVSSSRHDGLGYEVTCEGGVISPVQPAARMCGTTVEVRDLFFNLPARRKFMKSARAESMALIRLIEQLSVAFPAVHFTVSLDGKRVFDTPVADTPLERIAQIAGSDFAHSLIRGVDSRPGMDVEIFISPPTHVSQRARFQCLYVNLRRVDSDTVNAGVRQAFSKFISDQFRPSFFCFLSIDPARIDVNVHPTKKNIKFDDDRTVFSLVHSAVQRALCAGITASVSGLNSKGAKQSGWGVSQLNHRSSLCVREAEVAVSSGDQQILVFPTSQLAEAPHTTAHLSESVEGELWGLISCYQIHATYILAPIKNGILLIDQHAAHERVLYEQALESFAGGAPASQQLLFPIVIEFSPTEKAIVEGSKEYLRTLGFELSDFGGTSVSVVAIPAYLRDGTVESALRSMVEYLLDETSVRRIPNIHERYAAAFACGAAIKAGQKLDQEEMNVLLNNLFSTENPYTCPHGRPTVVRISLEEIARRFLR